MSTTSSLDGDTIAAIATAPGRGGVGIIRLSGPLSLTIAQQITATTLKPRFAHFAHLHDSKAQVLDSGIVIFFPGPSSYTGEDVAELQAHGGPIILDLILKECFK